MATFPNDLKQRSNYILEQIKSNNFKHNWIPIYIPYNDHEIIIYVSSDALKIDGVRVNVSAAMQQEIADMLNASFMTSKIADLVYQNAAIKIRPFTQTINSTTEGMILHSTQIDKYVSDFCSTNNVPYDSKLQIISNVGKYWILDNQISTVKAVNYGWFTPDYPNWRGIKTYLAKTKGLYIIQENANAHNNSHIDYSQTCSLVKNECLIDGMTTNIQQLFQDDELFGAVSYEKLKVLRQM